MPGGPRRARAGGRGSLGRARLRTSRLSRIRDDSLGSGSRFIVGYASSAVSRRCLPRADDASPSRPANGPGHGRRDVAVLKIDRSANGEIRFTLTGRVGSEHVAELRRLIDAESAGDRQIVLDLADVKLIDREAVSF